LSKSVNNADVFLKTHTSKIDDHLSALFFLRVSEKTLESLNRTRVIL
jgi:hypothetical protein